MKNWLEYTENLLKLGGSVCGVFSLMELSSVFNENSRVSLHNIVNKFIKSGILKRYCREIYTLENFDSFVLSAKIRQHSYISLGSALAAHRLIGTESPFQVFCVVQAKAANYKGEPNVSYYRLSEELYFGYAPNKKGFLIAEPEKAVLDTLYFYLRGKKFYFNLGDINYNMLNKRKFFAYLNRYNNPKFKTFASRCVNGKF